MREQRLVLWVLTVLIGSTACEADSGDVGSSATGGTSSSSSGASGDSALESGGPSSESSSTEESEVGGSSDSTSGGPTSCDGWMSPPAPYPWSYQDCLTEPCPEGEVCRYDPQQGCGASPVCVNPNTLACNCEVWGPTAGGLACQCPDYVGPTNELGQVELECNTLMSAGPVQSNGFGHCIN